MVCVINESLMASVSRFGKFISLCDDWRDISARYWVKLSEMKLVVRSLMLCGRSLLVWRAPASVANCFWYGDSVGSAHHPSIRRNWMSPLLIDGVHLYLLCLRVSLLVERLCVGVSVCVCVRVTFPDGQSLMTMILRHADVIEFTSLAVTLFASICRDCRRSVSVLYSGLM